MSINYRDTINVRDVITSAEATANKIEVVIIEEELPSDSFAWICQVRRAGIEIPGFKATYSATTGILTVEDAGSADLTEDDVVCVLGYFYA